ncbi:MAG TPA: proline racemase family protein [Fimbriimonadaceae bacterium]|nr:proline racemase family protein [Fimbriimonadaceae bacterium]
MIRVIDSHTEGEPTRVVIEGWPEPEGRTMVERREWMRSHQDGLRRRVVLEPRGHEAIVGAVLTRPERRTSHCGIVFFNDVGYLGMCGHGLIGVVRTLLARNELPSGPAQFDTPAGPVVATPGEDGSITFENVPARCVAHQAEVQVDGIGTLVGEIGYGGNWFFFAESPGEPVTYPNRARLLALSKRIRESLWEQGVANEAVPIDHVELLGPPTRPDADSKNFVLCPGEAYDRSPCGTGTSAKLACLHAAGKLAVGERWGQESITGSLFEGRLIERQGTLVPTIRGRAWITAESTLRFEPDDPFADGIV